jgi:hypothetical protein
MNVKTRAPIATSCIFIRVFLATVDHVHQASPYHKESERAVVPYGGRLGPCCECLDTCSAGFRCPSSLFLLFRFAPDRTVTTTAFRLLDTRSENQARQYMPLVSQNASH